MRHALLIHRDTPCKAVSRLIVEAVRPRPGALALRYLAVGAASELRPLETKPSTRADGLWRHSCFEAFVRPAPGVAYVEFNFALSTQWAAYHFDDYREGMIAARDIVPPAINVRRTRDSLELEVALDLAGAGFPEDATWFLGLSAVIEEADGRLSYWALAHPPGEPDFHHADCFALELAPPLRP